MKVKGLILGLGMITGLAIFAPVSSQAFVAEEAWIDYDPCWMERGANSCRDRTGSSLSRRTE